MAKQRLTITSVLCFVLFVLPLLHRASSQSEDAADSLREFNELWAKAKTDKTWGSNIPYADLKAYTDLTITEMAPMYDESIKSFVYKYYVDANLAVYKKYLFQQIIDEWFLHVPCYEMKDLAVDKPLKCPPENPQFRSGPMAAELEGAACITDKFGCNIAYNSVFKMYIISIDDLRRCGPGKIHAFVARTLGVRSPIQEPDRDEHVTVNFENVEIGLSEGSFESDYWRDGYAPLLQDLDNCRKTSEEVYQMKTAVFKHGVFDYGSVLVPETFQYSDPIDPRPVTVTKEIYEQVRLDRSKYGSDFRLKLTGNDLFRMRLYLTCGSNSKCFKKDGVCKNMGFIASSPLIDQSKRRDEPVTCQCFCPYSDLKGELCENNVFMRYKYLDTKATCFSFIGEAGDLHVDKLQGPVVAERGRNVLSPKGAQTFIYSKSEVFSDKEARALTQKQDALVAEFQPPAAIRKEGGLAAAPDVWVSKQWCTFIWSAPARRRAIVTVIGSRLWQSEEFTQQLPDVTKNLIENRGDCQRALKFVHSHGPDGSKLRVKCFSIIYFSPERPYMIWSNTTRLTAYIYWDWYLSQHIPRQLKHAMKLTLHTRFATDPAYVLGPKPLSPTPKLVERPDPPTVTGTTEYWMNPKFPMDDWFATVRNDNTKKIVLAVLAGIACLAMIAGAAFVLYYYMVKKPQMDDMYDEGYEKQETAFTTPAEGDTPVAGSQEDLNLN